MNGIRFASLLFFVSHGGIAGADQFHYSNLLRGDRALGMGGAYTAVADDASGLYYNPAGMAFAINNDISGSANAFYSKNVSYKNAVGSNDFVESSTATLPSFFGGLQKLDHWVKGLVFGFGIYTLDSELQDQNDIFSNILIGAQPDCLSQDVDGKYLDANGNIVDESQAALLPRAPNTLLRFHRSENQRAATSLAGGGFGWRVNHMLSLGVGLNYVSVDELIQTYQDTTNSAGQCHKGAPPSVVHQQNGQNVRQHVTGYGIQGVLGAQLALWKRMVLGLTIKPGGYVSQHFDMEADGVNVLLNATDAATVVANPGILIPTTGGAQAGANIASIKSKKAPLGSMPTEVRLGLAYFASPQWLFSTDTTYYSQVDDAEAISEIGGARLYAKNPVTNYAAGVEYYPMSSVAVRVGGFTNYDARPNLIQGNLNQSEHIDYQGGSFYLSWVQPNSQIGAGVIYQTGSGHAQKVSDSTAIQTVKASSTMFAFSASHNF